ncbi:hypothetical protein E2C01_049608 [Portunus trituberculatus]|uniref:Uncharacterized protein n=1 Tax=Portunus trituberculatus TaxID=210409 RepID=A0A5B7GDM6_PORTR|nr:hypothetical protein [Portunus trituberculatus]
MNRDSLKRPLNCCGPDGWELCGSSGIAAGEIWITINSFSTMTRFHIHSAYYLAILYSFRNLCEGLQ